MPRKGAMGRRAQGCGPACQGGPEHLPKGPERPLGAAHPRAPSPPRELKEEERDTSTGFMATAWLRVRRDALQGEFAATGHADADTGQWGPTGNRCAKETVTHICCINTST